MPLQTEISDNDGTRRMILTPQVDVGGGGDATPRRTFQGFSKE